MMPLSIRVAEHRDLTDDDVDQLRVFFDREYFAEYGAWSPDAPYGYAPADVHVMAYRGDVLLGHVGFQRRVIAVRERDVVVAGTGGVLVAQDERGSGLGARTMRRAQEAMRQASDIEFGYLGCRLSVVPFYESTGWCRIHAVERYISRLESTTVINSDDAPILICAAACPVAQWPEGDIDLRGRAW